MQWRYIRNPNDKNDRITLTCPHPSPLQQVERGLRRGGRDCRASPFAVLRASAHRNDDGGRGRGDCPLQLITPLACLRLGFGGQAPLILRGGLRTARGGRTTPGHSERASATEKPTGDELRHRTAIFWFSIPRVSTAIARARTTFPDAASSPNAGHPVNKKTLCQEVNRWD